MTRHYRLSRPALLAAIGFGVLAAPLTAQPTPPPPPPHAAHGPGHGPAHAGHTAPPPGGKIAAQATLYNPAGREGGRVTFTQTRDGLTGMVHATGLTPGQHGTHIHAVGKCEAPGFETAGGHLNPTTRKHGTANPQGPHQGDLPSITAGPDGTAHGRFVAKTTLGALFDKDGASFIIHAGPDDNRTDPSGNSGGRVLCGVLQRVAG